MVPPPLACAPARCPDAFAEFPAPSADVLQLAHATLRSLRARRSLLFRTLSRYFLYLHIETATCFPISDSRLGRRSGVSEDAVVERG